MILRLDSCQDLVLDQNLQKLSVVCSKEHGFRRTKTVFETVGLYSPLLLGWIRARILLNFRSESAEIVGSVF